MFCDDGKLVKEIDHRWKKGNNFGVNSVEEAARVSRLRWFGHVQRMQMQMPRRIMSEEVQGKRDRGRPRRRF